MTALQIAFICYSYSADKRSVFFEDLMINYIFDSVYYMVHNSNPSLMMLQY